MTPDSRTDTMVLLPVALRDTALTVASLRCGLAPQSFDSLRKTCSQQITRLREEMISAGHPHDVVEDAVYAQCALLDESALRNLTGDDRDAWEREPLQIGEFQRHDAGDEVISRIERRLAEPRPVLPLLAIFRAVLSLGFTGKLALSGQDAHAMLLRTIDERLGGSLGASDPLIVKSDATHRPRRLSALIWLVLSVVATGALYLALDGWLSGSIAGIAQHRSFQATPQYRFGDSVRNDGGLNVERDIASGAAVEFDAAVEVRA
ncbi:DotU/TssL family secretion system protein [Burkholderia stagnalis]|uniref:DotU/TssL family secretion system protein n=1 Tax=Burkholderia stagnalis TaxID=1503054 RepID=UPI0009C0587F